MSTRVRRIVGVCWPFKVAAWIPHARMRGHVECGCGMLVGCRVAYHCQCVCKGVLRERRLFLSVHLDLL